VFAETQSEWPHTLETDDEDTYELDLEQAGSLIRPKHLAAFFDLHEIVERLILDRADVDELDNSKNTALH